MLVFFTLFLYAVLKNYSYLYLSNVTECNVMRNLYSASSDKSLGSTPGIPECTYNIDCRLFWICDWVLKALFYIQLLKYCDEMAIYLTLSEMFEIFLFFNSSHITFICLCVVVADCDFVTPLCSQVTYEGLLDDTFGIASGKLTSNV